MKIGKSIFCFITLKIYYSIETVHEGKKPFKCNICDSSFIHKGDLNRHMNSVHEGKKPFKCGTWDASFTAKQNLERHIESIHRK